MLTHVGIWALIAADDAITIAVDMDKHAEEEHGYIPTSISFPHKPLPAEQGCTLVQRALLQWRHGMSNNALPCK